MKIQQSLAAFLVPKPPTPKPKRRFSNTSIAAIDQPRSTRIKEEHKVELDSEDDLTPISLTEDVEKLLDTKSELPTDPSSDELPSLEVGAGEDDPDYPPPNHPSYHLPPSASYNHPFSIPPMPTSLKLKYDTSPKSIVKAEYGLDLLYFKRFIDPSCSRQFMKYLLDSIPWYRVSYTVRGININTPRWTTVFGKDATSTPWEGYDKAKPKAIPPILLRLMQKVEQVTGETYNFTLVNYYASGTDSISYHSDSESFLGKNPCIASISLGASRDFLMRHVDYKTNNQQEKFALQDGDMVVMRGRTQHDWQHSIPKRKSAEGRINITFRKGIVKYATQNYNDYNVGKGGMYRWETGRMVEKK